MASLALGNIYYVEEYYSEEIWAHDFLRAKLNNSNRHVDGVPDSRITRVIACTMTFL